MKATLIGFDSNSSLICNYFQKEFIQVSKPTKSELLDILTDIIVGTKELRNGPIPPPEVLVNIRRTIKSAIDKNLPIPMLAPWGGRKTDPSSLLDIGEVSAIRQILCIDKMIKEFFLPGIQMNIGVEDLGAMWLYRAENNTDEHVNIYSAGMVDLVQILRGSTNVQAISELSLMNKGDYFNMSGNYSDLLYNTILTLESDESVNIHDINSYKQLLKMGWQGELDQAQREYYMGRYKALYNDTTEEAAKKLADYFAGAKVRYDLNGKGIPQSDVTGFIKVSFVPPIPNAPTSLFDSTVYWRTVPMSQARTHIAPWRGKGYLRINKNDVKTKITSWSDNLLNEMFSSQVELVEDNKRVTIEADYIIEA